LPKQEGAESLHDLLCLSFVSLAAIAEVENIPAAQRTTTRGRIARQNDSHAPTNFGNLTSIGKRVMSYAS
jgi:hypothetical protein